MRGDIRVCLDIPDGLWPVRVDPAQFELALLNVAVNARDAMPGGGSLAVAARNLVPDRGAEGLRGRLVEVLLRDTGEGIPREVLERVVEPFFTTKPPGKGTGLGLSQAHGFARQAGGALRIESEPGRGTEVAFLLPAAPEGVEAAHPTAPEAAARAPGSGALAAAGGGGARVLVVDDDPAVARMAVGMLESMGWRAAAVGGAEDALRLLGRGERFDAVLSDVLMPGGMGGVALAREIGRRWPGLPVLLATGYAGAEGAGPHGYPVLHKPYATPELAVALGALLAARRAPRGRGSRGGWAAEPEGEDERQAAGATAPGGARSGPEGPEGVAAPPPADHDDPGTPRGAETRVRAAEAGGGEAQAAKDTPEPDSLGG